MVFVHAVLDFTDANWDSIAFSSNYCYQGLCVQSGELLRLPRTVQCEAIARGLMQHLAQDECYSREGKMYGVLLVETLGGEKKVLKAFSGLLNGSSHVPGWVTPILGRDRVALTEARTLTELESMKQELMRLQQLPQRQEYDRRLREWELELQAVNERHKICKQQRDITRDLLCQTLGGETREIALEELNQASRLEGIERRQIKRERDDKLQPLKQLIEAADGRITELKQQRKKLSRELQMQMHEAYTLVNFLGNSRSLQQLMPSGSIPTGTGDCCAPKLLHYAALHNLKPLAMAEFWWGPSLGDKVQGEFYGACGDRCQPLMGFLLSGLAQNRSFFKNVNNCEVDAVGDSDNCEHPDYVRAKHDRRQFISDNQRFTAVMLRPYEYICQTQMHPDNLTSNRLFPLFVLKSRSPLTPLKKGGTRNTLKVPLIDEGTRNTLKVPMIDGGTTNNLKVPMIDGGTTNNLKVPMIDGGTTNNLKVPMIDGGTTNNLKVPMIDGGTTNNLKVPMIDGGTTNNLKVPMIDGGTTNNLKVPMIDGGTTNNLKVPMIDGGTTNNLKVPLIDEGTTNNLKVPMIDGGTTNNLKVPMIDGGTTNNLKVPMIDGGTTNNLKVPLIDGGTTNNLKVPMIDGGTTNNLKVPMIDGGTTNNLKVPLIDGGTTNNLKVPLIDGGTTNNLKVPLIDGGTTNNLKVPLNNGGTTNNLKVPLNNGGTTNNLKVPLNNGGTTNNLKVPLNNGGTTNNLKVPLNNGGTTNNLKVPMIDGGTTNNLKVPLIDEGTTNNLKVPLIDEGTTNNLKVPMIDGGTTNNLKVPMIDGGTTNNLKVPMIDGGTTNNLKVPLNNGGTTNNLKVPLNNGGTTNNLKVPLNNGGTTNNLKVPMIDGGTTNNLKVPLIKGDLGGSRLDKNQHLFSVLSSHELEHPGKEMKGGLIAHPKNNNFDGGIGILPVPEPRKMLPIIYEDKWLIIINKPANLLSVPGRYLENQDSVLSRFRNLLVDGFNLNTVHRLDFDTSGILILARDQDTYRKLSLQFEKKQVHKIYEAVLSGITNMKMGSIALPLWGDPENRPIQEVNWERGKPSVTEFQVIRREGNGSRIEFVPLTGRTHQLRVHAADVRGLGIPILGDRLYGCKADGMRLHLHAREISFEHPQLGNRLYLKAEMPF